MILTEWVDSIIHITLNRPQRRNALNHETLEQLLDAQGEAIRRNARALVISGAAPAFCAGADLSGVEDDVFVTLLRTVLQGFGSLPIPTIAAIDGPALGAGTQLAIACDLRIATEASPFGIPAAKLGIAVDRWTIDRMTQEIGWSISRNMLLAARTYKAIDLVGCGFVHRIGSVDEGLSWAQELAQLAPLTIAAHKIGLENVANGDASAGVIEAARRAAWASADATEGVAAFTEKRTPRFVGE